MNSSEHCAESNPASLTDTPPQSALEGLAPPAEDLLLDENLRHVAPKIDVLLAEGLAGSETLQAHVAALGKATTPLTPLHGGTAVSSIADRGPYRRSSPCCRGFTCRSTRLAFWYRLTGAIGMHKPGRQWRDRRDRPQPTSNPASSSPFKARRSAHRKRPLGPACISGTGRIWRPTDK